MTDLSLFFYEIFLSLTLSSIVIWGLATPLRKLLQRLSHSEEQAIFWLAYTRAMLFLSPLFMVVLIGSVADAEGLVHIKVTLISALGGLVLGLMIIGRKMYTPSRTQCPEISSQNQL